MNLFQKESHSAIMWLALSSDRKIVVVKIESYIEGFDCTSCWLSLYSITARYIGPYPGVQREVWRGVQGTTVTDLVLSHDYPNKPTETTVVPDFDAPKNEGDDYGSRMRGYFVAPYTGTYSFSVSGNDQAELYFSGSSREKDKDLFAVVHGTGHNDFAE